MLFGIMATNDMWMFSKRIFKIWSLLQICINSFKYCFLQIQNLLC
jgi:hypothetical protein